MSVLICCSDCGAMFDSEPEYYACPDCRDHTEPVKSWEEKERIKIMSKITYEGANLENWSKERLIQELRSRVASEAKMIEYRDALDLMLQAFDPEHPGACDQECFNEIGGHGYEVQEAAKEKAKEVLGIGKRYKK